MSFKYTHLANDRMLVEGDDPSTQAAILFAHQWYELKRKQSFQAASDSYNAEVAAFYAPLTEAAERVIEAQRIEEDDAYSIVLSEAVEHTCGANEERVYLNAESAIARLVELGQHDRLRWVGGNIVITAKS